MNILTDEEIGRLAVFPGLFDAEIPLLANYARAIEAEVAKMLRKQIIEEICFKMAAGSPNRERIHKLIDGWVL